MNGWELSQPVELLARDHKDAIREFARDYQMAATNPEATGLVVIRKYAVDEDGEQGRGDGGAAGLGKGFRVGLTVFTATGEHTMQLPTLRTYLSLSLVGQPDDGDDRIVIETDMGEALTNLKTLQAQLPAMSAGVLKESVLEDAYITIE